MDRPVIINVNSAFDWTKEVRDLWKGIDWDSLKSTIVPSVTKESWERRRDELVLIGLCSSLLIERAYSWNLQEENEERVSATLIYTHVLNQGG